MENIKKTIIFLRACIGFIYFKVELLGPKTFTDKLCMWIYEITPRKIPTSMVFPGVVLLYMILYFPNIKKISIKIDDTWKEWMNYRDTGCIFREYGIIPSKFERYKYLK